MKSLVLVALLLAPVAVFSQMSTESQQGVSKVDAGFEQYCLENALTFMPIPEEKRQSVTFDGNLPAMLPEGSTYKDYGLELKEDRTQYYSVQGSNKVLAVKSLYSLRLNYSNSKQ